MIYVVQCGYMNTNRKTDICVINGGAKGNPKVRKYMAHTVKRKQKELEQIEKDVAILKNAG